MHLKLKAWASIIRAVKESLQVASHNHLLHAEFTFTLFYKNLWLKKEKKNDQDSMKDVPTAAIFQFWIKLNA